jgi:hypothetical protein
LKREFASSNQFSAKGFNFTGQGLPAGWIEGTTPMGYCSHMILEVTIPQTILARSRRGGLWEFPFSSPTFEFSGRRRPSTGTKS